MNLSDTNQNRSSPVSVLKDQWHLTQVSDLVSAHYPRPAAGTSLGFPWGKMYRLKQIHDGMVVILNNPLQNETEVYSGFSRIAAYLFLRHQKHWNIPKPKMMKMCLFGCHTFIFSNQSRPYLPFYTRGWDTTSYPYSIG